ncbi:Transport and Golgi organization protein 2 -like protein [Halotydeus destructor]|nr:Transport and Golgi organization protein 2 -like protein [Halotydeus destructor]
MCLLFFESKETSEADEYQLVLASVRDEFYTRATQPAQFWPEHSTVIGGRDLHPGKEGGTWLAVNGESSKIGALLNILQPSSEFDRNVQGRGFLVNDYVTGSESPETYLERLSQQADSHNGYVMVTMDLSGSRPSCFCYSNQSSDCPRPLGHGVHGFGNSRDIHDPWPKVTYGKRRFESILSGHTCTDTKEQLIEDLFQMLGDRTRFPLTAQMLKQGPDFNTDSFEKVGSLCVDIPEIKFGSRTWTIILVDGSGNVDFIEKTMQEPIKCNRHGVQPDWMLNSHHFKLGLSNLNAPKNQLM